jgi:3-hydroxybutyrate dehydrogenase
MMTLVRAVTAWRKGGVRCANMLRPSETAEMVATTEKGIGQVNILANNAGIHHVAPVEDRPIEKWDAIIAINLCAAFHAVRLLWPA